MIVFLLGIGLFVWTVDAHRNMFILLDSWPWLRGGLLQRELVQQRLWLGRTSDVRCWLCKMFIKISIPIIVDLLLQYRV